MLPYGATLWVKLLYGSAPGYAATRRRARAACRQPTRRTMARSRAAALRTRHHGHLRAVHVQAVAGERHAGGQARDDLRSERARRAGNAVSAANSGDTQPGACVLGAHVLHAVRLADEHAGCGGRVDEVGRRHAFGHVLAGAQHEVGGEQAQARHRGVHLAGRVEPARQRRMRRRGTRTRRHGRARCVVCIVRVPPHRDEVGVERHVHGQRVARHRAGRQRQLDACPGGASASVTVADCHAYAAQPHRRVTH